MEIRRSFESFTENDYLYAFRISISHLHRLSDKKNFDAQMASGSVKGTIGIKSDARCFIVDAL